MDLLTVKNPQTKLSLLDALNRLSQKGYDHGQYSEYDHLDDPAIQTVIINRNAMATTDFIAAATLINHQVKCPLTSHVPEKANPATMQRFNQAQQMQQTTYRRQLKACQQSPQHQSEDHGCEQLSLFTTVDPILDRHLCWLDLVQLNLVTIYINGEMPDHLGNGNPNNNEFARWQAYFKALEDYYLSKRVTKPELQTYHLTKARLKLIENYHINC